MTQADLEEVASEIAKALEKDSSATVVCGQDLGRKQNFVKTVALPI